jgi:hypothetical protein
MFATNRTWCFCFAAVITSIGCGERADKPPLADHGDVRKNDGAVPGELELEDWDKAKREFEPSFVAVLAAPERYHQKKIRLEGFLHVEFEGDAIYLSKDDADHLITRNGLWVDFDKKTFPLGPKGLKQFHRKWVLIEGVVDMNLTGHMSGWTAGIKEIDRIDELKRYYNN